MKEWERKNQIVKLIYIIYILYNTNIYYFKNVVFFIKNVNLVKVLVKVKDQIIMMVNKYININILYYIFLKFNIKN